jgi:hypothetical protein
VLVEVPLQMVLARSLPLLLALVVVAVVGKPMLLEKLVVLVVAVAFQQVAGVVAQEHLAKDLQELMETLALHFKAVGVVELARLATLMVSVMEETVFYQALQAQP